MKIVSTKDIVALDVTRGARQPSKCRRRRRQRRRPAPDVRQPFRKINYASSIGDLPGGQALLVRIG